MKRLLFAAALLYTTATTATAQDVLPVFDSVAVSGNQRVRSETIITRAGIPIGEALSFSDYQRAIDLLYASGQFSDVALFETSQDGKRILIIEVTERPMLGRWSVQGADKLSSRKVRGRVQLLEGRPFDPAAAARSRAGIDSLYKDQGYYLSRVDVRQIEEDDGSVSVVFDIEEGRRIALSRIEVENNDAFDDGEVVGHMQTGTEGFWWWANGEYSDEKLDLDRRQRLPDFYGSRGYIDFQVLGDTLIVDEATGKGTLVLRVAEGEKYVVGDFEIVGNRQFTTEQLEIFYPFEKNETGFLGLGGGDDDEPSLFDQDAWNAATQRLQTLYNNNGYIYARITPVVARRATESGGNVVDLRWQIFEGSPAIVNKVIIRGNTVTHEDVIRRAISVIPGDVFRQDALIQSYQRISNLGFFEQPLPPPNTEPINQQGDVDIIFTVQERHTGNVNFGASVGQGVGVGGFIGLDEPNFLGRGKRVAFQWQFGRNINDFNISYTDPALRGSLISSTVSFHSSRLRFTVADLGRIRSRGASIQFGFPLFGSRFTRIQTSYSLEQSEFDSPTLSSRFVCRNCVLSSLGASIVRDTRIGLPYPTAGTLTQVSVTQHGGPLGGSGDFRRLTFDGRWYAPLAQLGADPGLGSAGIQFVLGLKTQTGFVWGDVGPHFRQLFSMGGTQFGIPLRGYDEFSVTPFGFDPRASGNQANTVDAFGGSYFQMTGEVGARLSQALYFNLFADVGNVYATAGEFNPTKLFRGVGLGVSLLSPLGPIGIDYAYGFDRRDLAGNPNPGFKFHFRLGNIF